MGATPLVISCLCLSAALLAGLLAERRHARFRLQALARAQAAHAESVRLLRLTAGELRTPALLLQSHAERTDPALAALARRLLDVAEGLLDQTEEQDTPRQLSLEPLGLRPLLDFVVAQIVAGLGPGQRAWNIAADLDEITLLADRRALYQILLRVLTTAALATRDADWIDIHATGDDASWALVIEDEGNGLPVGDAGDTANRGPETRGLGVGLALARRLMQAHGGLLSIESTAQVGTRAVIRFPRERLIAAESIR